MILGYFDETFDQNTRSVWLAGHIGAEHAWHKYVCDWKSALGSRRQLHMKTLRWKKKSEQELLSKLGPIPFKSGLRGLTAGVRVGDFADLVENTRLEHYLIGYGYLLCVLDVATQAILSIPDSEHLKLVLEKRDQTQEHADDVLFAMHMMGQFEGSDPKLCNSDGSVKLAKWGFMSKANTVLFDQADYLCYALLQQDRDSHSRKALWSKPILQRGGMVRGLMSRDTARDTFAEVLKNRRV